MSEIEGPEIPVTKEMIEAGARAGFEQYYGSFSDADAAAIWKMDKQEWVGRATVIYREMAAVAPKPPPNQLLIDPLNWAVCVAELEAENAALRQQLATFVGADSTPADLPDPPRRPDGTLKPQPKPWTPPKDKGDPKRIGG